MYRWIQLDVRKTVEAFKEEKDLISFHGLAQVRNVEWESGAGEKTTAAFRETFVSLLRTTAPPLPAATHPRFQDEARGGEKSSESLTRAFKSEKPSLRHQELS